MALRNGLGLDATHVAITGGGGTIGVTVMHRSETKRRASNTQNHVGPSPPPRTADSKDSTGQVPSAPSLSADRKGQPLLGAGSVERRQDWPGASVSGARGSLAHQPPLP